MFHLSLSASNKSYIYLSGTSKAKRMWYGLERRAPAIFFGRESTYNVRFEAAVLERQDQRPATFSED